MPWYEGYETNWPRLLQRWDLRADIGIEFTYINFVINGGHARVIPTSHGEETKEDFYHRAMPVPTIGLEAYRRLNENFIFQGSIEGNWINRWNSLRDEGGTVSYYYTQDEDSSEDGNFIRWSSYGPEAGVSVSF